MAATAGAVMVLTGCGAQTSSPVAAAETNGTDPSRSSATIPTDPISSPPSSGPLEPAPEQTAGTLFDFSSGAFFLIDLGVDSATHGHIEVVIPHVGMAWSAAAATFSRQIASTSTIRYDGRGFLDEHARLNATFPIASRPSGHSRRVSFRVEATLNQGLGAGHATVWLDGHRYQIAAAPPRQDAGSAVRAVLRALRHERWAELYRISSRSLQSTLSEGAFVRSMTHRSPSRIVVRVSGPIRYTVAGGIAYAEVPASESFTAHGRTRRHHTTVVLVRETGGWRFLTTR